MRVVDDHILLLGEYAFIAAIKGGLGFFEEVLLELAGDGEKLGVVLVENGHEWVLMGFYRVTSHYFFDAVEDVIVEELLLFYVDVLDLS